MCSCRAHNELVACTCQCDHGGDRISQWKRRALMAEESILAAAMLLWPEEDWGPTPPGSKESYHAYLSEGLYETADALRKARKS